MKNIYKKYVNDDALRVREIKRIWIFEWVLLAVWLPSLIALSFFSDKMDADTIHSVKHLFVLTSFVSILVHVKLMALMVIDALKDQIMK
jgi:hypothetical protein